MIHATFILKDGTITTQIFHSLEQAQGYADNHQVRGFRVEQRSGRTKRKDLE